MAGTNITTTAELDATLDTSPVVVLDVWAPWCGPCKAFAPVFDDLASELPEAAFVKVNADESPEIVAGFGVRGVPTVIVFRDAEIVFEQAGVPRKDVLRDVIAQALGR